MYSNEDRADKEVSDFQSGADRKYGRKSRSGFITCRLTAIGETE